MSSVTQPRVIDLESPLKKSQASTLELVAKQVCQDKESAGMASLKSKSAEHMDESNSNIEMIKHSPLPDGDNSLQLAANQKESQQKLLLRNGERLVVFERPKNMANDSSNGSLDEKEGCGEYILVKSFPPDGKHPFLVSVKKDVARKSVPGSYIEIRSNEKNEKNENIEKFAEIVDSTKLEKSSILVTEIDDLGRPILSNDGSVQTFKLNVPKLVATKIKIGRKIAFKGSSKEFKVLSGEIFPPILNI